MSPPQTESDGRRGVLLLGNRRQSLTVIRALKADGWEVFVGLDQGDDRNNHAHRSRDVAGVWPHRSWKSDPSGFANELTRFLDQHPGVGVVFPIDESAIKQVDARREELEQRVGLAIANREAVRTCLDKQAMLDRCRETGVPHRAFSVTAGERLRDAVEQVGLPCVVKPMDHETLRFGVKAEILREPADTDRLASDPSLLGRRLMVQGFAVGPRYNLYFAAVHGRLVDAVVTRTDRTDRVDGTGLSVAGRTVEPSPALVGDTEKLIASLGYHGAGLAQFLYDGDESTRCFLEINPRLGANLASVYRAGLKLPEWMVRLARGESLAPPTEALAYRRGLRFAWGVGALAGCRFEWRQGVIGWPRAAALVGRTLWESARAGLGAGAYGGGHITWSWRDPLPTLLELSRPLYKKPTQAREIVSEPGAGQEARAESLSGASSKAEV